MITDKQIEDAINVIKCAERHNVQACLDEFKKVGQHAIPPELFIRQLLEGYEQSKWVKFDAEDESTYPPFYVRVLTKHKGDFGVDMGIDFMTHSFEWYNAFRLSYETHWQPLPEFKE